MNKKLIGGILSFAKGLVGGINPVVGMVIGAAEGTVKGLQKEKDNNLNSEIGGAGKIDIPRLAGVAVFAGLVIAMVAGLIDLETLKELFKIFNKAQ